METAKRVKKQYQNQIHTVMNPEGTNMWSALGKMIMGVPDRKPKVAIQTIALPDNFKAGDGKHWSKDFYVWLGHSSVFLNLYNKKILIDPVFSATASPLPFVGPKAFPYSNNYSIEQFPPLDIILISHDHYDHLDKKAIQILHRQTKHFVVPENVGPLLTRWGVSQSKIVELNWSDEYQVSDNFRIVAQSGRHFSGRGLANRNSTLWCSYILEGPTKKVFFSGDSGFGNHFEEIGSEFGPFDLAFIECGQYNEHWPQIHMMPEESAQAAKDIRASTFVPIHWGKFPLSLHAWDEPPQRASLAAKDLSQDMSLPTIGQINYLPEN